MQTCPGFFFKSLLEYPGNLLEICSVKSVDTLFNPRRLQGPKRGMSSHATDLRVYAKSSSSSSSWLLLAQNATCDNPFRTQPSWRRQYAPSRTSSRAWRRGNASWKRRKSAWRPTWRRWSGRDDSWTPTGTDSISWLSKCASSRLRSTTSSWLDINSLSLSLSLSLRFNGHFPGEPGLAGVYWSKGWWKWRWQLGHWSYKSCKARVKSSPPTNQHLVFLQAGCPSCRPTNSVKALKGKITYKYAQKKRINKERQNLATSFTFHSHAHSNKTPQHCIVSACTEAAQCQKVPWGSSSLVIYHKGLMVTRYREGRQASHQPSDASTPVRKPMIYLT